MAIFEGFLWFIMGIILSSIIYHYIPKVPLSFIQIAIGFVTFLSPIPVELNFESEVFMVGIIAPLLFLEGITVSRVHLARYLKPVMSMALVLVFTTVLGIGFILHWIWPELPLAACFAIGAIVSPTDAVAVQAIAKGKVLPKGAMTILQGESLLNDAAGILSFKIALAALVGGSFSLSGSVGQFMITAVGGAIVGLIIGYGLVQLRVYLTRNGINNGNMLTFIQVITPFLVYIVAETFHSSGIIAAVIAGLIHGVEKDRIAQATTKEQVTYNHTWDLLSYLLNGFVFILLGFLIPEVLNNILEESKQEIGHVIFITIIVSLLVYLFRYIWVLISYRYFYLPESRFSRMLTTGQDIKPQTEVDKPNRFKYAFIMTICGVNGTISLAIALMLPYKLSQHQDFIYRDNLLFIATGVILISLVVAQITLPLITPKAKLKDKSHYTFKEAKILLIERALEKLQEYYSKETSYVHGKITRSYHMQLSFLKENNEKDEDIKELERIRKIAINTEFETIDKLISKGEISQSTFDNYRQITERSTTFKNASLYAKSILILKLFLRRRKIKTYINATSSLSIESNLKEMRYITREVHYQVVKRLSKEMNKDNEFEISLVCDSYLNKVERLTPDNFKGNHTAIYTEMEIYALRIEREMINELLEDGKISRPLATKLRESVNYDEMIVLGNSL
ncbi:Na+/H+ antiporter [Mammaliicoccus stepanovicii]|uniref:Na+/H+ antiporter n=1 Tax=Mammaliicoccus stepanovicii TaxID=643214 RepID=A0A240A333_9STAP|nr:Na+/H+ antiporter [Mammaliicoccus stepanovicii]PNZ71952.1 Na+/H+ antiporter [Mammaliicoccus stepanovicii]GGI39381.1 sodium:proton antiporter [Mammaliicoccus stepanovicii]SNV77550.1 Na+/H+ antiporter [Mammaliicoccus stepanovicii]